MNEYLSSTLCPLFLLLCLSGQTLQLNAQQPQALNQPGRFTQEPAPAQEGTPVPPYYVYPYGSTTTTSRTLTMDEAVALALANASVYQQSLLGEQSARDDVRQARAAFLPQFNVPLGYIGTTPFAGACTG